MRSLQKLLRAGGLSVVAALLVSGLPVMAQPGPITFHPLTPKVYWVEGGIGNVGVVIGETGVTLIDTTISAEAVTQLLAKLAQITPKPVTRVIITHGDVDHVSGLAGLPAGLKVYAHQNTIARMGANAAAGRGRVPADRVPNVAVGDHLTLTGDTGPIALFHWAPAHTDGDLVVFLPQEKIVFTGDIFALDRPRALIHPEQNGSSAGWVTTAQEMLKLAATRFVVGHGAVQTKADLAARAKVSADERAEVVRLDAQGKSLAEIQRAVNDPAADAPSPKPGGPRFDDFSKVIFDEIHHNAPAQH
jgi:cyclase